MKRQSAETTTTTKKKKNLAQVAQLSVPCCSAQTSEQTVVVGTLVMQNVAPLVNCARSKAATRATEGDHLQIDCQGRIVAAVAAEAEGEARVVQVEEVVAQRATVHRLTLRQTDRRAGAD